MALFVSPSPLRVLGSGTGTIPGGKCSRYRCTPTAILSETQDDSSRSPKQEPNHDQSKSQAQPLHELFTDIIARMRPPPAFLPKNRENVSQTPGQVTESVRPEAAGDIFTHMFTSVRSVFDNVDMNSMFNLHPGGETVHVLRINSPKAMMIELNSGVHEIHEGENILKFRDENTAIRTAWKIKDAAAYQRIALHDISVAVQKLSSNAGLSEVKAIPERDISEIDPLHFLPEVAPPDENDLNDWMGGVHWEDTEHTRFICDNTLGPDDDAKLEQEWKETLGKLSMLKVDNADPECRLCGGSGRRRCSRCGGAASMALPGSSFLCVCYNGEVACSWCAGDGIPR